MPQAGLDVAAVRALARTLTQRADEIESLIIATGGELAKTAWVGDDRRAFQERWETEDVPALKKSVALIRAAAQAATANAVQQEQASR